MTKEYRILHLEDVPSDSELAERQLRDGGLQFSLKRVGTKDAFEAAITEFAPDLVLCDYKLPNYDGAAALEFVRQTNRIMPVIMLTGTLGDELAVDLVKKGAADYVLKANLSKLALVVNRVLKDAEVQLAHAALGQKLNEEVSQFNAPPLQKKKMRLLLLEDVDSDAELTVRELQRAGFNFDVRHVQTEEDFRKALEAFSPDLILLDYKLPTFNGLRALEIAKRDVPKVPCILISGKAGEDLVVEFLRKGATDYVLKQRIERLAPVVRRALDEQQQQSDLESSQLLLMETQERLRQIVNNIEEFFFLYDPVNNEALYLSPSYEKIWGVPVHVVYSRPESWLEAILPEDRNIVTGSIKKVMTGANDVTEFRVKRPDGSLRWVRSKTFPVRSGGKEVTRIAGIGEDVTEEKFNAAKLRESERQTALIFENVSDTIFLLSVEADETYRFVSVNKAFAEATGVPRDQVVGRTVQEVIPRSAHALALGKYREAIKDKRTARWEEASVYPTGTKYGVVSVTPLYDDNGTCILLVGAVHDVTDIRKNEARLKELDALKNKFIQVVSHQFRTPLNAVRWNLESLLADEVGELTEGQRQFVRLTHDATLLSIERLRDLLTALDIEEGRVHVEKETVDISSLVSGVMQGLKKACGAKNLQCRYEAWANEPIEVAADPEKLRAALEKLAANAVLYSEKGGEVVVSVKKMDGHVRITFTDHGVGIPKAEQKKIFTRFFRASNAATMLPDASGLGLYIVKYFIEAQGGKIGFESEEGKGSTFWVEMPL